MEQDERATHGLLENALSSGGDADRDGSWRIGHTDRREFDKNVLS